MAKKHQSEFRPDPKGPGFFSRMYITPSQRMRALKWFLYGVNVILLLVLQDVIFSRMNILGATTDLVPAVLLMVCVMEGVESGGLFVLIMSGIYLLSGSAPISGVMILLTVLGMGGSMFRESFLRKGFSSAILCAGTALMVYELAVFLWGLMTGLTLTSRVGVYLLTGVMSVLCLPGMYPILKLIGKIGGETWKE